MSRKPIIIFFPVEKMLQGYRTDKSPDSTFLLCFLYFVLETKPSTMPPGFSAPRIDCLDSSNLANVMGGL